MRKLSDMQISLFDYKNTESFNYSSDLTDMPEPAVRNELGIWNSGMV